LQFGKDFDVGPVKLLSHIVLVRNGCYINRG
jgi:hypothetical protein